MSTIVQNVMMLLRYVMEFKCHLLVASIKVVGAITIACVVKGAQHRACATVLSDATCVHCCTHIEENIISLPFIEGDVWCSTQVVALRFALDSMLLWRITPHR